VCGAGIRFGVLRGSAAFRYALLQALARYIREQKQLDVPLDAFRLEQLPAHLLMNFRVMDEHGRQLGMSRNFAQLRGEWAPKQTIAPVRLRSQRMQRRSKSPALSAMRMAFRRF